MQKYAYNQYEIKCNIISRTNNQNITKFHNFKIRVDQKVKTKPKIHYEITKSFVNTLKQTFNITKCNQKKKSPKWCKLFKDTHVQVKAFEYYEVHITMKASTRPVCSFFSCNIPTTTTITADGLFHLICAPPLQNMTYIKSPTEGGRNLQKLSICDNTIELHREKVDSLYRHV